MGLFGIFGRKPPPPAPASVPVPRAPIALARAPAYQPLPVNSADPVDAEVVLLWRRYQRTARAPSWHDFLATLTTTNADLAKQVQRAQTDLADYRRMGVFKP